MYYKFAFCPYGDGAFMFRVYIFNYFSFENGLGVGIAFHVVFIEMPFLHGIVKSIEGAQLYFKGKLFFAEIQYPVQFL